VVHEVIQEVSECTVLNSVIIYENNTGNPIEQLALLFYWRNFPVVGNTENKVVRNHGREHVIT
jgi:hypothetical protein